MIPALELCDDTGKSIRDVILIGREMHKERLEFIDERVHEIEVADGEGCVANDEVELVDCADGCRKRRLDEVGDDEAGFIENVGSQAVGVGVDGCYSVEE